MANIWQDVWQTYGTQAFYHSILWQMYGNALFYVWQMYGKFRRVWSFFGKKSSDFPSFYNRVWKSLYAL